MRYFILLLGCIFITFKSYSQSKSTIEDVIDKIITRQKGCFSSNYKLGGKEIFVFEIDISDEFKLYDYGFIETSTGKYCEKYLKKKGYVFFKEAHFYDAISAFCYSDWPQRKYYFYAKEFDEILKNNNIDFRNIKENSRNRTPRQALSLYPQHREFIKEHYKDWCKGFNNCEEYLAAFPQQKYDSEISKNQERRRAASDVLVNYGNKVVEGVKEMPKKMLSESVESLAENRKSSKEVGTFDDFTKKSKMKFVREVPFSSFGMRAENHCPCREYELDTGEEHVKYMFKNTVHKIYEDENKNWWLKQPVQTADEKFESLVDLVRRIYDKNYN